MKFIRHLLTWLSSINRVSTTSRRPVDDLDPVKAERERVSAIASACALAGRPELALQYIDDPAATVSRVQKELRRMKGQPSAYVPRVARQFADIAVDADSEETMEETGDGGGVAFADDAPFPFVDRERIRAAEIVAACLKAGKPSLALNWICDGASVGAVQQRLVEMIVHEGRRPRKILEREFDQVAWVCAGLDVSKCEYVRWRHYEETEWRG